MRRVPAALDLLEPVHGLPATSAEQQHRDLACQTDRSPSTLAQNRQHLHPDFMHAPASGGICGKGKEGSCVALNSSTSKHVWRARFFICNSRRDWHPLIFGSRRPFVVPSTKSLDSFPAPWMSARPSGALQKAKQLRKNDVLQPVAAYRNPESTHHEKTGRIKSKVDFRRRTRDPPIHTSPRPWGCHRGG